MSDFTDFLQAMHNRFNNLESLVQHLFTHLEPVVGMAKDIAPIVATINPTAGAVMGTVIAGEQVAQAASNALSDATNSNDPADVANNLEKAADAITNFVGDQTSGQAHENAQKEEQI